MTAIVRNLGDLKHAKNVDGEEVHREEFITFHGKPQRCINTDTHFIYRSRRLGSSILCTCGSSVVSVGYGTYRSLLKDPRAWYGVEALVCYNFVRDGKHADGSS